MKSTAYQQAGVSLDAADEVVDKDVLERTTVAVEADLDVVVVALVRVSVSVNVTVTVTVNVSVSFNVSDRCE